MIEKILVPKQFVEDVHDCFTYLVERGLLDINPFDEGSSALDMIEESKYLLQKQEANNDG